MDDCSKGAVLSMTYINTCIAFVFARCLQLLMLYACMYVHIKGTTRSPWMCA